MKNVETPARITEHSVSAGQKPKTSGTTVGTAYQRGYRAGRKVREPMTREAFRNAAFLAALPACIAAQGWSQGERKFFTMPDKVELAWDAADNALAGFKP